MIVVTEVTSQRIVASSFADRASSSAVTTTAPTLLCCVTGKMIVETVRTKKIAKR